MLEKKKYAGGQEVYIYMMKTNLPIIIKIGNQKQRDLLKMTK
jgi:hypothetical protein